MKQTVYKSYDELPLMLSVPEVASVLGISRAGAYELVRSWKILSSDSGWEPESRWSAWMKTTAISGTEVNNNG